MKYVGPLYGKIGRRTIPLKMSSTDVDRLQEQRNELLEALEEQEMFNEWLRVSDPDDPFSLETMRHKMNYCADLRKAAITKAKEPLP